MLTSVEPERRLRIRTRGVNKLCYSLSYDPPFVHEQLRQFRELIEEYSREHVEQSQAWSFLVEPKQFQTCKIHGVFLHQLDPDPSKCCLLCNNAPID